MNVSYNIFNTHFYLQKIKLSSLKAKNKTYTWIEFWNEYIPYKLLYLIYLEY